MGSVRNLWRALSACEFSPSPFLSTVQVLILLLLENLAASVSAPTLRRRPRASLAMLKVMMLLGVLNKGFWRIFLPDQDNAVATARRDRFHFYYLDPSFYQIINT